MTKTFTLASLFLGLKITAQTLTYANYSSVLTATTNLAIANNSSFNTALNTTTGNGVTWNAAGITQQSGTPAIHFVYVNPSTTPNGSLFPTANYAQYDPALTSAIGYEYYNISADSMTRTGTYDPSTAHEIYSDPDKRLIFPFSYGQSFNDNYKKTNYSNSTTISSVQTGSRTVTFNGFGTLILPQGSFSNVALISELRTNSLGGNEYTYTWIDIFTGNGLLYYHDNAGSITTVYTLEAVNAVQSIDIARAVTLAPNPVSNNSQLSIKTNETLVNSELSIFDSFGREISKEKFDGNKVTINKGNAKAGLYFYEVKTSEGLLKGKVIFE
ncbi:MAG: T9SS type A sorting domain-containing protein [Bacteroidia bacterium]